MDVPAGANADISFSAADFDRAHGMTAQGDLQWRLAAEAYGADYPAEVEPWGMTTWWTLGHLISGIRVGPGGVIVDLACGRGGPGLWLARASGAALIGVDWSPVAIDAAAKRADSFVPPGRARFVLGDLVASGLPDATADAVICVDAVFFASDRVAALREVCRILKPGARYVFTAPEMHQTSGVSRHHVPDWTPLLEMAGLSLISKQEIPRFAEQLGRMYQLWLEHIDELRAEVGEEAADDLVEEATTVGPSLADRVPLLITAERPQE